MRNKQLCRALRAEILETRRLLAISYGYEPIEVGPADAPVDVVATDLDADGDLDLVSASRDDGRIVWYENGPHGVEWKRVVTHAPGVSDLLAADITGDGRTDLVSASSTTGNIVYHHHTTAIGFFRPNLTVSGEEPGVVSIDVADLDADGKLDVVAASAQNESVSWYRNLGDGQFSDQRQIVSRHSDAVRSVYAADLDGDGDRDVLMAATGNTVLAWHENLDGQGTFGAAQILETQRSLLGQDPNRDLSPRFQDVADVISRDIDGDGDQDVLAISPLGTIRWYENTDGQGEFVGRDFLIAVGLGYRSVDTGDFDGDGDLDVVVTRANVDRGWMVWFENIDGLGSFLQHDSDFDPVPGPVNTAVADFDGDGDVDVATAALYGNEVAWHANDGAGRFKPQHILAAGKVRPNGVRAADLDGDGDHDTVVAALVDGALMWYENLDEDRTLTKPRVIDDQFLESLFQVQLADIDGDGDTDVAAAGSGPNMFAWYENLDGQGEFSPRRDILVSAAAATRSFELQDVDGDEDLDGVLTIGEGVAWVENLDGHGNFGLPQSIRLGNHLVTDVATGDLDGDGDADVAYVLPLSDQVVWHPNLDGNGQFGPGQVVSNVELPFAIEVVDLVGNGANDLVVGTRGIDGLVWFRNRGRAVFDPLSLIDDRWVSEIHSVDLNRDGDPDLVAAGTRQILAYHNLGTEQPTFEAHVVHDDARQARTVFAVDYDRDGDIDILSGSAMDQTVALHRNLTRPLGDINGDQLVNGLDVDSIYDLIRREPYQAVADLNQDGRNDQHDVDVLVFDLLHTSYGDANLDGIFSSSDLVQVFHAGAYDNRKRARWSTGDWNGDGFFDSSDLVLAFQKGAYIA